MEYFKTLSTIQYGLYDLEGDLTVTTTIWNSTSKLIGQYQLDG